ncbi:hypothetical protein C0J52_21775 [Blattella germanica]|nr:hypothetical protein C0J52_21775 [Blattella germanica]
MYSFLLFLDYLAILFQFSKMCHCPSSNPLLIILPIFLFVKMYCNIIPRKKTTSTLSVLYNNNEDKASTPIDVCNINLENAISKVFCKSDIFESILNCLVTKVVDQLKESIDFNSKVIEDLKSELEKRDMEIQNLQMQLHKFSVNVQDEYEDINQYSRRSNIEIHGFPESNSENIYEIVSMIGNKIGCDVDKNNIDIAHRIPSHNISKPRPIIIQVRKEDYDKKTICIVMKKRREPFNNLISTPDSTGTPAFLPYLAKVLTG